MRNKEAIDERNIKLFNKRYGITLDDEKCYTCTICFKKVDLWDSMSDRGHKLVCNECYYNKLFEKFPGRSYWHQNEN